jgi:hypothetical protein
MKEKAQEIVYKSYIDYGIIVLIAVAAVAAVWFLLKYLKTSRDKYIIEKETQIKEKDAYIAELRLELSKCREQSMQMANVISANTIMMGEVKGILFILNEKLIK